MRKPRILLHCPEEQDGTSFYRGWGPYSRLDVELVRPPKAMFSWSLLSDIDVVVFQRPSSQLEVVQIEICKRFNKPVVVDWDDAGTLIDELNPAADFYRRDAIHAALDTIAKLADIITVSTQALKDVILSRTPGVNITVIPNAVDEQLFSLEPSYHERNKIILMRGGGSHQKDWLMYKDGILKLLKDFPEYKLAAMGFHPDWLKEIPANQIQYYKFTDLPSYFETLMQLRPEIMIVPLADTEFNRCKSAIAYYEGSVAGAVVLASNLPEFAHTYKFSSNEELYEEAVGVMSWFDEPIYMECQHDQLALVPRLSDVNELRKDVIELMMKSAKRWHPHKPELSVATDKEFHEYSLAHGHTQDDPVYNRAHSEAAAWLVKNVNPKTAVEYGCGTGGTLLHLLKAGVMAYGLEINPYSVDYFKEHHPMYANQVSLVDFTKEPIEGDDICDLGLSIEVFEHISMPDEWWDGFIYDLSKKYRRFYFSSTPYSDTEYFDKWWSHCNLRRTTDWIKLFEANGWKFESNPKLLTSWDLYFSSKNV